MTTRQLGTTGPRVHALGLGCMGMSWMYGPADEDESVATIHAAIDHGVTLLDTGDFYGNGHNEMLLGRALKGGKRDQVLLSVKFGALRSPDGQWGGLDTRPAAMRNFLAYTLQRLGVDYVDIYRPSRLDPAVPIEETIGAIAEMVKKGYVRHIGLSEMGPETIRRAQAVHPISDLQIEYSLVSRGPEKAIFPALDAIGVGATIYGVLSRGLLTRSSTGGRGDFRSHLPRFRDGNRQQNEKLVDAIEAVAAEKGVTPVQLLNAYVLAKRPKDVVLVGARKRTQLEDALKAVDVRLTPEDVARLEAAVPAEAVAGTRYDEHQMKALDSEKG